MLPDDIPFSGTTHSKSHRRHYAAQAVLKKFPGTPRKGKGTENFKKTKTQQFPLFNQKKKKKNKKKKKKKEKLPGSAFEPHKTPQAEKTKGEKKKKKKNFPPLPPAGKKKGKKKKGRKTAHTEPPHSKKRKKNGGKQAAGSPPGGARKKKRKNPPPPPQSPTKNLQANPFIINQLKTI
ncbi:hypothetical protein [Escherichia coli]|uniref:hypothetical protein n=1 Tax=Escherichia coli TaxID=562 RepID=UPI0037DD04C3